ncbi:hypothetical protein J3R30DRAFT_1809618 [Lentinula aciculospora]|uniref:PIN domain-like protein n=1 Tax=Lentinula aciculospora TaxID=153920 RepID=A0A9W9A2Q5_9AGAR|nr:hypothetical protein J3R30DRAFT_1099131 [Lentinula aciculospora]KAJ4483626.1 hypothetical protein J3R30DRAFT_1809618 [Lentinula aciculospora]
MGVHGLTTFLREHRELSKTVLLPLKASDSVYFVVDGWSFIYELQFSLPWVYGGEYTHFAQLITNVVHAWLGVGVKLSFVFDGPAPEIKFRTLTTRMTKSHIEPSLLFFRTSQVSRSTPRFLNESRIIPPLSYSVAICTLLELQDSHSECVDIHLADEEGDPYAVELAGRLGAYVVANDSDFAILNTEGYRGFIPLQSMVWHASVNEVTIPEESNEWVQAGKKRPTRNPNLGRGIIPPLNTPSSDLTFSFTVHSPEDLSSFLDIPITLLPLLGALVGNDFSNQSAGPGKQVQQLFFEPRMTSSARINRVATTLRSILSLAQKNTRKQAKYHVDSVMDLIGKTVKALLTRSLDSLGSGEVEEIVERVVDSTLQYAIPKYDPSSESGSGLWPSPLCALHQADLCPMLPSFSRNIVAKEWTGEGEHAENLISAENFAKLDGVRSILMKAYRAGKLSPNILNCLNSGSLWARLFLENPDVETTAKITRPIRIWCCSILDDAVGLPEKIDDDVNEVEARTTDSAAVDEDEVVDVVESDSEDESPDMLAPLKGALRRLHEPNGDQSSFSDSSLIISPIKQCSITEYYRRGTRVIGEAVEVPSLSELLAETSKPELSLHASAHNNNHIHHNAQLHTQPLLTRSSDERLAVFFRALNESGDTIPKMKNLSPEQLLTALAFRWLLRFLRDKAVENPGSKDKQQAKWTEKEAKCFLAAFAWDTSSDPSYESYQGYPPILDRHVQLTSQILQCLESVQQLAEVLLLSGRVSTPAHLFSGRRFHAYLTNELSPVLSDALPNELWDVCVHGLGDALIEERVSRKERKSKKKQNSDSTPSNSNKRNNLNNNGRRGGLYDLLGDVEA